MPGGGPISTKLYPFGKPLVARVSRLNDDPLNSRGLVAGMVAFNTERESKKSPRRSGTRVSCDDRYPREGLRPARPARDAGINPRRLPGGISVNSSVCESIAGDWLRVGAGDSSNNMTSVNIFGGVPGVLISASFRMKR